MSEMLLLGAGASVEAGVPDTYKMTKDILHAIEEGGRYQVSRILKFVIGGLLFQKGVRGEDPFLGVNIEDLFNAIQLLAERTESEINPFVGSWHPMFEQLGSGDVSSYDFESFLEELYKPIANLGSSRTSIFMARHTLMPKFTSLVKQITGGVAGQEFRYTNRLLIRQLINFVLVTDEEKVAYLNPIAEKIKKGCQIASLNYDNTIEMLAKKHNLNLDTGIDNWSKTSRFTPTDDSTLFLKLHGSIDWKLISSHGTKEKPMPFQEIQQVTGDELNSQYEPALIFGGKNKLTSAGPYLDMLRAFKNQLANCRLLTIVGYSFRDDHVNKYISDWINDDSSHQIAIINPSISSSRHEYVRSILRLKETKRLRVYEELASTGLAKV